MNTMTRQEQYRQQVLSKLINEIEIQYHEKIYWHNLKLPFMNTKDLHGYGGKPSHYEQFYNYVTNNYGILSDEVDELWKDYSRYIFDLHKELDKKTFI